MFEWTARVVGDSNSDIVSVMAQVIIRNLDDRTVSWLKARAAARGRSLEQELRLLLTEAARPTRAEVAEVAGSLRSMSPPVILDLEALIREDRDR